MQVNQVANNVFTIPGFFSGEECDRLIKRSEKSGYEAAAIKTEKGIRIIEEVRNNQRVMYKDEVLAAILWKRVAAFAPSQIGNSSAIGLNELFRFYKYEPGQRFKKHFDESFIRNEEEASYYTLMIYLNEDFEGGETTFDTTSIKSEKGMALIFLHSLAHEGKEVTKGIKYVLRTDIMYRLNAE
ncbi:MAG TPA: 2OG-Fe(II) oxygenase [Chitinophagaceae bacterium]|nr:2OG-Fe(II) oxygenase [Chitinophagaceae bacterium]